MPSFTAKTHQTVVRDVNITLNNEDIIRYLNALGYEVPSHASVSVYIPGGGDWSNTDLNINNETKIEVRWRTKEEKSSE